MLIEFTDSCRVNDLLKRAIVYVEAGVDAGVTESGVTESGVTQYWVVDMCSSQIHGMSDADEMTT